MILEVIAVQYYHFIPGKPGDWSAASNVNTCAHLEIGIVIVAVLFTAVNFSVHF